MSRSPPSRILAVVYLSTLLALVAFVLATVLAPVRLDASAALDAFGLGLAVLLARRFPVHLTDKTKTAIATAPLFAAALLLPPPLALLVAALGAGGAEGWRRAPWFQNL